MDQGLLVLFVVGSSSHSELRTISVRLKVTSNRRVLCAIRFVFFVNP